MLKSDILGFDPSGVGFSGLVFSAVCRMPLWRIVPFVRFCNGFDSFSLNGKMDEVCLGFYFVVFEFMEYFILEKPLKDFLETKDTNTSTISGLRGMFIKPIKCSKMLNCS